MGTIPSWILRWGNILILVIIISVFAGGFFISYPETVSAPLKLMPSDPLLQTENLKGVVMLSSFEIEKIKKGQKVLVRFPVYPEQEYGLLIGIVSTIYLVPDENSFYKVEVSFPDGNKTDHGNEVETIAGMEAHATIITKDARVIDYLIKL